MANEHAFPKTEVGVVEIKTLPAGVVIESRAEDGSTYYDRSGDLFRPLFRYISERDIAMTVPVEADLQPGVMRFWIAESEVTKADASTEEVTVRRLPERTVASLGVRGGYSEANYEEAKAKLQAWLKANPQWQPVGEPFMAFWDGPMTPWFVKRSEIHQAVVAREPE